MGHSRLKFKVRVGKDWAVRFEKMVRLNILTERDIRVRRWNALHFEETRHTILDVLRIRHYR